MGNNVRPPKKQLSERSFIILLMAPTMVVLLGITLYPLLYNIYLAFHSVFLADPTAPRDFIWFENFVSIFTNKMVLLSFLRSFIFTAIVVSVEFFLALAMAAFLNREFMGKRILIPFLILPLMVTPVVSGLIWKYMFNGDFGLIGWILMSLGVEKFSVLSDPLLAFVGVVIQDIWHWTPFLMLLFYTGLISLPKEPFEAAAIDGASSWQIFRGITVPMLRKIFLIGVLLRTMDAFKIFDEIYMMTQGGPGNATETVNYYIYRNTFRYFNMGEGAALALVVLAIIIIFSNIFIMVMKDKNAQQTA
jgi:multiple sugar transport system permease protein